jgi:two-component system phosphate regulon sensor histidine kinase PhoR
MSESENLTKQVEELRRELQASKAQTKNYLQNVAHQLTAPLGAIKWSIEALKDDGIPIARKANLLSSVYSQASILVHLIKNFALMSNLDADEELGQMRNQDPVDLMRLCINLANDFQPQAFEGEKKIAVNNDSFRKILGSRMVRAEKNLVAQAISNLLENAVKYADARTTISVAAEKAGGVGVSVTSEGLPIAQADKANLFQRGFRGATAKQRVAAGTGIGLYLATRVMHLHQGEMKLETNGKVSRFTLVFPQGRIQ